MPSSQRTLRLGTRGSKLALAQSRLVADQLIASYPDVQIDMVICKTTGDRVIDRPLQDIGGKGLFIKEIEEALLRKQVDFAVHSYKDMPVTEPLVDESELMIAAVPKRLDAGDVMVSRSADAIESLRPHARVGTGSLRRRCQLLALRPDLEIVSIRGNIDTRIARMESGDLDAVILAAAGLQRCGLWNDDRDHVISLDQLLPAAAQGALALQCQREDSDTLEILRSLDDATTRLSTDLERGIVAVLNGDCQSPIAALAEVQDRSLRLRARVGKRFGELPIISADQTAPTTQSRDLLHRVASTLKERHAIELLTGS